MPAAQTNHQSTKLRFLLTLLGFASTFLLGDQLLSRLRLPYVYGSRNAARAKCELYERAPVTPDVVFLGSSYELCAINPAVIDAQASRRLHRPIRSLNLAASAAGAQTQAMMLRRILENDRLPKLVYIGVCPAGSDATQHWWVLNGLRALGDLRDLPLAASISPDLMWDTLRTGLFASRFRWEDSRIALRRILTSAPVQPNSKLRFDENGWAEWTGGPRILPHSTPPSSVDRASDGIRSDNAQARALRDSIRRLKKAGVIVRLLETPVSAVASGYDRADANPAYRKWIDAMVAATLAPLIQPPSDLMQLTDYFDPFHMNPAGAERFSRWLAGDVAKAVSVSASNRAHDDVLAESHDSTSMKARWSARRFGLFFEQSVGSHSSIRASHTASHVHKPTLAWCCPTRNMSSLMHPAFQSGWL